MKPLSGRAIQREILAEALQHPTTLYSFAVGAVAASYAAFVGPFLGGQIWAAVFAAAFGALAAGSFGWRYFVRGESEARARAQRLIAAEEHRHRESAQHELEAQRSDLEPRAAELGWEPGARVLADLAGEYGQLLAAAENYATDDPLVGARVRPSAAQDYRDGLRALEDALDILQTIETTDRRDIETEVRQLEGELADLERTGLDPSRASLLKQTIEAERTTLGLLTRQSERVKDLLHEAELAEAALRRARIGLPSMTTDAAIEPVGGVAESAAVPGDPRVARRRTPRKADVASDQERIRN